MQNGCGGAGAVYVYRSPADPWLFEEYIKASTAETDDRFGEDVTLSQDGRVLATVAPREDGCDSGIDGNQNDNRCSAASAAYSFVRSDAGQWRQRNYIKASNLIRPANTMRDSGSLSLSADGENLVVSGKNESGCATGVDGERLSANCRSSGAAYLY